MTKIGRTLVLLALVAMTIGCDRVTKHAAVTYLEGRPGQSFFGGTVRLEYAENVGGFLGLGTNLHPDVRTVVFTLGTLLILAGTLMMAIRLRLTGTPLIGISLMFAGGASNLADRVVWGSVIDFLNVGLGPVRTGIFNVADVAIVLGACVVLFTYTQTAPENQL